MLKRDRVKHSPLSWMVGLFLLVGFSAPTWAAPPQWVSPTMFQKLVQQTKDWTTTCTRWKGTLRTNTWVGTLPAKAGTTLELYLLRILSYPRMGKCLPVQKPRKQRDYCSVACVNGKPWSMVILDRRVRALTLARDTKVNGFPFKAGTRLNFRSNGKLKSATLVGPQALGPRKLKRQVKLSQGSLIHFIPAPNPKVWRLPKVKIFRIGDFNCYYTGSQLAMVCTF